MTIQPSGMSDAFCHWQMLTDRYARQLEALRRLEPGAAIALSDTQRLIEACRLDVQAHGATGKR